jgi:hypothetical protein
MSNDVIRSPEEETLIDALVAGEIDGLVAVCPSCERMARLQVICDEEGPFDACCAVCANQEPLDLDWLYELLAEAVRGRA